MAQLVAAPHAETSIEKILTSPTTLLRLKEVLQQSVSAERFARVVLNVIRRTPKLLLCTQESLFGSILVLARWGLEPGTDALAEAFLVPYKDECQPQASYRGLVKMVRRAAGNIPIWAEVVKEGDKFDYVLGDDPYIRHKPSDDPDREEKRTTHAYAVAKLSSEEKQSVVMTRAQLDRIKNMSAAVKYKKTDSPWFTNPDEMDKKTVTRRLTKGLPMKMEEAAPVEEDTEIDIGRTVVDVPKIAEKSRLGALAEKVNGTQGHEGLKTLNVPPADDGMSVVNTPERETVPVNGQQKPAEAPKQTTSPPPAASMARLVEKRIRVTETGTKAAETKGLKKYVITAEWDGGNGVLTSMQPEHGKLAQEAMDTGMLLDALWEETGEIRMLAKLTRTDEPKDESFRSSPQPTSAAGPINVG